MSLYVEISANDTWIGTLAVTRTTSAGEHPDAINEYQVTHGSPGPSSELVGTVSHRYGDGAYRLAETALNAFVRSAFVPWLPASPGVAVPPTAQVAGEPEPPPATTTLSDRLEKGPW